MISVLVIDDSKSMCLLLSTWIDSHPNLRVVGQAYDALQAEKLVKQLSPDVITLDLDLPNINGMAFLDRLMKIRPTPVVVISAFDNPKPEAAFEAMRMGAVDYIAKSELNIMQAKSSALTLNEKLIAAATANLSLSDKPVEFPGALVLDERAAQNANQTLIAIGASTGGTEAIKRVIQALPKHMPPIVIVIHMPKNFTASFARRLDQICSLSVVEAVNNTVLENGHVYIAPGDEHMKVQKMQGRYRLQLEHSDKIMGHRPSVSVLFHSVAGSAGRHGIAALLTGMGKDGADGLLAIKDAEGFTIAQDELSSVVYGMPKEAVKLNAHCAQLPLSEIAARLTAETNCH